MRPLLFLSLIFILVSCSSSEVLVTDQSALTRVHLSFEGMNFVSEVGALRPSVEEYFRDEGVREMGDSLLALVAERFRPDNVQLTKNADEADIIIQLKEARVEKGFLTLNIPHPGPIYRVSLNAVISGEEFESQQIKVRNKANMSVVNFDDQIAKWLNASEKQNPGFQKNTIWQALRESYQDLYFKILNIRI